ncbi:hypothetical protein Q8A64_09480 [Oxalobacteraceae bacterium R-40]|uniref:Response regulatory domain-containing protein n=1 Tax=Keguizhuia sedimenti TaxID=3064264 RepID=A0ABU1BNS1_9BURK|nr:hypothetical protein [Oxalobacteraceae bacterium R-40]
MASKTSLKILVAIRSDHQELISSILEGNDLTFVHSLDQAYAALSPDFDLIVCGLHFENGRMYDFLKFSKAYQPTKDIPFLCVQLTGGILAYGAFKSMVTAFDVLGGDLFVQLAKWRIELGDEQAFRKLLDVIRVVAAKRLHLGLPDTEAL